MHQIKSTSMSRRSLLLLAAATTVSFGFSRIAKAQSLSLKVNYYNDYAPFSFFRKDGTATGIMIDALDEVLGRRCGVGLTHRGLPWEHAQREVREGKADAFCTLVTDVRREYANFSREELVNPERVVVFAKNNPKAEAIRKIKTQDDLKNFGIGTYAGDSRLETLFKGMKVDIAADVEQLLQKIVAQHTDITVTPSAVWRYHARAAGIRDKLDEVLFSPQPGFHLGIRKTYKGVSAILERFDKAVMEARKDGTLSRIIESYG